MTRRSPYSSCSPSSQLQSFSSSPHMFWVYCSYHSTLIRSCSRDSYLWSGSMLSDSGALICPAIYRQLKRHKSSFSNFTLKYVDASFYQVARGMVLPFTVATSFIFLHSRPSFMILCACSSVTLGFFVGVFLDGTRVSMIGIFFGVTSSMITAMHSVVIKRSLEVVKGSALHLSWYTNLFSAIILIPVFLLAGEGPGVYDLFYTTHYVRLGQWSPLTTFLWGSAITVSLASVSRSEGWWAE